MPAFKHAGLEWDVASPSFWRLAQRYTDRDTIDISYLGTPGNWTLFHAHENGEVSHRIFETRDAAIDIVAQAFKNVGLL